MEESWHFLYEGFRNLCRYAISVFMFCCNEQKLMKLSMKNGFYLKFLLLPLLGQRNNQIKCKTRTKHAQVPHPSRLTSDLNSICECRFWSEMVIAFKYKVATCIFVTFCTFNVIDSNKHIFMTYVRTRSYSKSFNKAYALHFSWPNFLSLTTCHTNYSLRMTC